MFSKNDIKLICLAYIVCMMSTFLIGCAQPGGAESIKSTKELFSTWSTGSGQTLELTGAVFGTQVVEFELYANASCLCNLTISGSQSQGTANIGSCTWTGGGASQCGSIANQGYTYLNVGANLSLCNTSNQTCTSYK